MAEESQSNLVWVDLEMTGLNVDNDRILEIACIVTDSELKVLSEGVDIVIHEPDDVLESMNPWCIEQHGKSGLTERVRKSSISLSEAEDKVLDYIKKYAPPTSCPLAGNSVHCDKKFIDKYMPRLSAYLHYRIVDVSTIKELARRWMPQAFSKAPAKALRHRALVDIQESIAELQYFRATIFKKRDA